MGKALVVIILVLWILFLCDDTVQKWALLSTFRKSFISPSSERSKYPLVPADA